MNRFKFQQYQAEFPWLKEILQGHEYGPEDLTGKGIAVSRMDAGLFGMTPRDESYEGVAGKRWTRELVHFISGNAVTVDAVRQEVHWQHANEHTPDDRSEGETILEGIARWGDPNRIEFIVVVHSDGCSFDDTPTERSVTIFKPPKGKRISNFVDEAREKARCDVLAEVALADEPA